MPTAEKNPFMRGKRRYPHLEKARMEKARKKQEREKNAKRAETQKARELKRQLPKLEREYSKLLKKLTSKTGKISDTEAVEWDRLHKLGNQIRSTNYVLRGS